tara:strand:+ start:629 stop:1159 length:531 start_codon:yes stop_codon:yes gene_type:complete
MTQTPGMYVEPHTNPKDIGLTDDKIQRLIMQDPEAASNSIMPKVLSKPGCQQACWAPALTDILRHDIPRRPPEGFDEAYVNNPYVGQLPIYDTDLQDLAERAGTHLPGTRADQVKQVQTDPMLEAQLWNVKAQRDVDAAHTSYPGSIAEQLTYLADLWDVDARSLKTMYRTYGGYL